MIRPANRLSELRVTLLRQILSEAPADAIHLSLGQTNEPVSGPVIEAARRELDRAEGSYGPNAGEPELRARIAAHHEVPAERVIVTAGVEEALALSILGTVDPGDEVVVPDPGFPVYANLTKVAGGTPVPWRLDPTDGFRPTLAGLEAALSTRTRLVVLGSPGNPTGALCCPDAWMAIHRLCAERGIACLSDEIYLDLVDADDAPFPVHGSAVASNPDALVASGLSKTAGMAGWRLGWLIVPPPLVAPLTAFHQHLVTSASTLVQRAALGAFTAAARAEVRALSRSLSRRRRIAREMLEAAGWEVVSGDAAFYLMIRHPAGGEDDVALCRHLMREARVVTIPGSAFGAGGRGMLRLSHSVPETLLVEAIGRIGDTVIS